MIKKEINSKVQAKRVARELAKDLHAELDIYGDYKIKMDETSNIVNVRVVSERVCSIITHVAMASIMEYANAYRMIYKSDIDYHLDVEKWKDKKTERFIPSFVFCVHFHEKEEKQ